MTIESTVPQLTAEELRNGFDYLNRTRDELIEIVADLSEAQWTFKPAAGRWSAGENVEHLGIVEGLFLKGVAAVFGQAPRYDEAERVRVADMEIVAMGVNRGTRISAPERLAPSGTMRPQTAVARLLLAREHTREFLSTTPELRERYREHPVVGPIDGYQWVLLVAAHTERHRLQIAELKSDPRFPQQ